MSNISIYDRVKQFSDSTGTGNFALGDIAQGFMPFSSALQDGEMFFYAINDNTRFEIGSGVYIATSDSFVRHCMSNSNGDTNNVNFPAGRKEVFITYPASQAVTKTAFPELAKSVDYSKLFTLYVPSFDTESLTLSYNFAELAGVDISGGYSSVHTVKSTTVDGLVKTFLPDFVELSTTLSQNGNDVNINFHFLNKNRDISGGDAFGNVDVTYSNTTAFSLTVAIDIENEPYTSETLSEPPPAPASTQSTVSVPTLTNASELTTSDTGFILNGDTVYPEYTLNSVVSTTSPTAQDSTNVKLSVPTNSTTDSDIIFQVQKVVSGELVDGTLLNIGIAQPSGDYSYASLSLPLSSGSIAEGDTISVRLVPQSLSTADATVASFSTPIINVSRVHQAAFHGGKLPMLGVYSSSSVPISRSNPDSYTIEDIYAGSPTLYPMSRQNCLESITDGIKQIECFHGDSVLVLSEDGVVYGMGDNGFGQLGLGDTTSRPNNLHKQPNRSGSFTDSYGWPSEYGTNLRFTKIACGDRYAVGLSTEGILYEWGRAYFTNSDGSAPTYHTIIHPRELRISPWDDNALNRPYVDFAVFGDSVVAVDTNGVMCYKGTNPFLNRGFFYPLVNYTSKYPVEAAPYSVDEAVLGSREIFYRQGNNLYKYSAFGDSPELIATNCDNALGSIVAGAGAMAYKSNGLIFVYGNFEGISSTTPREIGLGDRLFMSKASVDGEATVAFTKSRRAYARGYNCGFASHGNRQNINDGNFDKLPSPWDLILEAPLMIGEFYEKRYSSFHQTDQLHVGMNRHNIYIPAIKANTVDLSSGSVVDGWNSSLPAQDLYSKSKLTAGINWGKLDCVIPSGSPTTYTYYFGSQTAFK